MTAPSWLKKLALVSLGLGLAAAAIVWLTRRAERPRVTIEQVSVQIPVNNQARVMVQLALSNTLEIPLEYASASYRVEVGGHVLATGSARVKGRVAAGTSAVLTLPMTIDLTRLKALGEARTRAQGQLAHISGSVSILRGAGEEVLPFSVTRRLKTGGAGIVSRVSSVRVHLASDHRAEIEALLRVKNPTTRPLRALGADYRILLDGALAAEGKLAATSAIPAGGEGPVKVTVSLPLPGRSGARRRPRSLSLRATVRARVGQQQVTIPLRVDKELPRQPRSAQAACTVQQVRLDAGEGQLRVLASLHCGGAAGQAPRSVRAWYRAAIDGVEVARGTVTARSAQQADGLSVQLPISVDTAALRRAKKTATRRRMLSLTGQVTVGRQGREVRLPFLLTREIDPGAGTGGGLRCELVELPTTLVGNRLRLAPRLRISSDQPLPPIRSLEASYRLTLAGKAAGQGRARLLAQARRRQLLARAVIELDLAALRRLKGQAAALTIAGEVKLATADRTLTIPYTFTRTISPGGGKPLAIWIRGVRIDARRAERLDLILDLGLGSGGGVGVEAVSAAYTAYLGRRLLLRGTLSLPALRPGRPGNARLRLSVAADRLRTLQSARAGGRIPLLLRGTLSATLTASGTRLRVPFSIARSIRPGKQADTVDVQVKEVRILSTTAAGVEAQLVLELGGELTHKVKDLEATYRVRAGGRRVVEGKLQLRAGVAGRSVLQIPLTIDTSALEALRRGGAQRSGKVPLLIEGRLKGTITAAKGRPRKIDIPYAITKELALGPPSLDVSVERLDVQQGASRQVRVSLLLRLRSRLAVTVERLDASYAVSAAGSRLVQGRFELERLAPRGTGTARVPLTIDTAALKRLKAGDAAASRMLEIRGRISGTVVKPGGARRTLAVPFLLRKELPAGGGEAVQAQLLGLRVKELSPERIVLSARLRLTSQHLRSVSSVRAHYTVSARGHRILAGSLDLAPLPAATSVIARLPVTIEAGRLKAIRTKNASPRTPVLVEGRVTAVTDGELRKKISIPFTLRKEVVLMKRPIEVKLRSLRPAGLGSRTLYAVVELRNRTPLAIRNLRLDGKILLARGIEAKVMNRDISLRPWQTTRLDLHVHVERGAVLQLLREKLGGRGTRSRWRLSGKTADGATIRSKAGE